MPFRFLSVLALFTAMTFANAHAGTPRDDAGRPLSPAQVEAVKLQEAINGAWRSRENRSRDRYRHPRQTLVFFGISPSSRVIEITPGGGWYSEILAPYLRDDGHYVGAMIDPASTTDTKRSAFYQSQWDKLGQKFAAYPAQFDKAEMIKIDPTKPDLGKPGSADMVLTFRNVHNWMMADQAQGMFDAFFKVLRPGGVLGVVEHRARNADRERDGKDGYVATDAVMAFARNAGFELSESSEVNANRLDSHDHPEGVWTLPPTLRLGDQDRRKYLTIGESDRMTLRFVKPLRTKAAD